MIEMSQLTFAYRGKPPIFEGFSWHVADGEAWAVIGPSGCGKSTLLYLAAGLRQPLSGRVLVDRQPVPRPRASTGLILQDYGLLPWATVWENVALVMRMGHFYASKATDGLRPYPRADITPEQVNTWLSRLGIAELAHQYPGQISGGQRQRVAIARSLLQQPNLLLMDEPFASLDALTRDDLQRLIMDLRRETRATTVVVTHNIEEAVFLGEQILVLGLPPNAGGRIITNRAAGATSYRAQPEYWARCTEVQEALAAASGL